MRVLIVDSSVKEREATVRLLPVDTHEIRVANDAAEALSAIELQDFDVALVETTLVGTSGVELVKRIRARESDGHLYIIATAARPGPADLKTAFLAGADDFVRKPLARDELLARMDGPTRIRRWMANALSGIGAMDPETGAGLTSMTAWTTADTALCSELSDMLGVALTPSSAANPLDGAIRMTKLPLVLAAEQTEASIAIGVDEVTAAALAEAMLGSPNADATALADMMNELANVAAGAFKRMAATDGRVFTTGLPVETTVASFRQLNPTAHKHWIGTGTVAGVPIALRFEMELRTRAIQRVRTAGLREGMVLATDLRNPLGALLMPAGTRITESEVGRLRRSLGADMTVEVLEAA